MDDLTRQESLALQRPATKKRRLRVILLVAGPLLVLGLALYYYATGGRYAETDDAYVHAYRLSVSADISARIVAVHIKENQHVRAGELLLELDPRDYMLAVNQARADLEDTRNAIVALKAGYQQREADLRGAESTVGMMQNEYNRRSKLVASKIIATEEYEQARNQLDVAQSRASSIRQDISKTLADLGGDPNVAPEDHVRYRAARAKLDQAELNLARTKIYAPFDGTVSQTDQVRVGTYVTQGQALFALVDSDHPWIEANLKETDLTGVRPGQHARVIVDTYAHQTLDATVASVGAGTGAEFALLPPQNATGNWVKIVQRVPVRLTVLNPPADIALRAGLSTSVSIDTGHARGLGGIWRGLLRLVGLGNG
ncbi:MAG TPA: HlyD family secretion protein [Dongiaceae bacterium]|jgi:membrane fusion protein (multidrug efflux system)|nr:HlyD family secretion protein [Dongiaceae bacterium]